MVKYCCVKGCKNNSNNKKEYSNINTLFHLFPSNPEIKARWLKVIGRAGWDPPENACICSYHFNSYQINLDFESSPVEVCRICLATDDNLSLYSLQYRQLKQYMDTVLPNNSDSHIEGLPQFVCYQCAVLLKKCYNMIKKIQMSQAILQKIFAENGEITIPLIKDLNRQNLGLKSTLDCHNITPTYLLNYEYDYQQNISCLTSIEYLYDLNETKIELDANSDTTSMKSDCNDINEILKDANGVESVSDNVLYFEDEINVGEEYSILYIDDNSMGISEKSIDENNQNILRSTEKLGDYIDNTIRKNNDQISENILRSEKLNEYIDNNIIKRSDDDSQNDMISTKKLSEYIDNTIGNSADGNCDNILISTEQLFHNSNVKIQVKTPRSRQKSNENMSKGHAYYKYFEIVKLKTMEEKINEWHKSTEKPVWLKKSKNHKYNVHKCEICSKMFANLQTYKQHSNLHDPISGNAECPVCKIRHKNQKAVKSHMNARHNKKYYCKLCPNIYSNGTAAEKHFAAHMGRVYRCQQCSFTSRHMSALSKHKQMEHSHAVACELCGRACVNLRGLQQHRDKQHRGQTIPESGNKYPCEQCNLSFTTEDALRVHLLTSVRHKELKKDPSMKNTCRFCGRKFSSSSHLRTHMSSSHIMRRTHNEYRARISIAYPKVCEHCDDELPSRLEHYWHMRREHPHKGYQGIVHVMCEICGRGFQQLTHLEIHKLRHSSPKVPCPICQKLFYDKWRMKKHVTSVHRAERPFLCNTCGISFKYYSNMIRHTKIHTDLTPYECPFCGKLVKHKANLHIHIRTVHQKIFYPSQLNRKKRSRKRARDIKSDVDIT